MDTVTSLPGVTEPGDFELIGFTGRQVVVAAGDDRGFEVGAVRTEPVRRLRGDNLAPDRALLASQAVSGVAPIRPDSWLPVDGSCG